MLRHPQLVEEGYGLKACCLFPQVLQLCCSVISEDGVFQQAGIDPVTLAAIALIESGGRPDARLYKEHLGDVAYGLCQVREGAKIFEGDLPNRMAWIHGYWEQHEDTDTNTGPSGYYCCPALAEFTTGSSALTWEISSIVKEVQVTWDWFHLCK